MIASDYRIVKRPEPDLRGAWGLWSEGQRHWIDAIFATEREASETLNYLLRDHGGKDRL